MSNTSEKCKYYENLKYKKNYFKVNKFYKQFNTDFFSKILQSLKQYIKNVEESHNKMK